MTKQLSTTLIERFEKLGELQEGWDSYGAVKPDSGALELAATLVHQLTTCEPKIIPGINGTIGIIFGEVEFEVMQDGTIDIEGP